MSIRSRKTCISHAVYMDYVLCMDRDEKAKWIRSKYEDKEFLPLPPYVDVAMPQVAVAYCQIKLGVYVEGWFYQVIHTLSCNLQICCIY